MEEVLDGEELQWDCGAGGPGGPALRLRKVLPAPEATFACGLTLVKGDLKALRDAVREAFGEGAWE